MRIIPDPFDRCSEDTQDDIGAGLRPSSERTIELLEQRLTLTAGGVLHAAGASQNCSLFMFPSNT